MPWFVSLIFIGTFCIVTKQTTKTLVFSFYLSCTVHCNVITQYKPTKCPFVKLIFLYLRCLLHVSKSRVYLQEGRCTYKYGIICLHAETTTKNFLLQISDCKQNSKHVEDLVNIKILV